MGRHQRRYLSQNITVNRELLASLVDRTNITKDDTVYDIGAGTGNITGALLAKGARVTAIEKDAGAFRKLCRRFHDRDAVSLHHADFLLWEFSPGHRYKVFANIPFISTADIVKKLLFNDYPPDDCYLIMQKEAALKYAGLPGETLASLLIKPLFWVDVVHYLERKDFFPPPSVDIVLIQFEKRQCRLVPPELYGTYRDFIVYCREGAHRTAGQALGSLFDKRRVKEIATVAGIDLQSRPAGLNLVQYLCVFQSLIDGNPRNLALIRGAEERLARRRAGLKKIHRTRVKQ